MVRPRPFDQRDEHGAPVLTPVESRQGVVSGRVLMILTSSLLLAAIAAAILYAWPWA